MDEVRSYFGFLNEEDYRAQFENALKVLFTKEVVPEVMYNDMFLGSNLDIFICAFTHASVEYDDNRNYQKRELRGDKIIGDLTIERLEKLYPRRSHSELSNMFSHYSSNIIGYEIFKEKIKMEKFILSYEKKTFDESADVYEALFGALKEVGNRVKRGMGLTLCANFFEILFRGYQYDEQYFQGAPKTRVVQMFHGIVEEKISESPGKKMPYKGTVTLRIPDAIKELLARNIKGVTVNSFKQEFTGSAPTKPEASAIAYEVLLKHLEDLGATPNLSRDIRRGKFLRESGIDVDRLENKFNQLRRVPKDRIIGKDSLDFNDWDMEKTTGEGEKHWRLVGFHPDGTGKILAWATGGIGSDTHHISKNKLLSEFVEGLFDKYYIRPIIPKF